MFTEYAKAPTLSNPSDKDAQARGDAIIACLPRLRRYARALAGSRGQADDLVHDTIARALDRWHLWREGGDLRAWLFAIMHNINANQARKKARSPVTLDYDDLRDGTQADQHERLAAREILDRVATLGEDQRAVVLLVGLEGLAYEDAAKILDVPVGTVMSRLSRARARLREDAPRARLKVIK